MSLYDYRMSLEIAKHDYPFYALIMAAMRQADTDNIERLKTMFPHIWRELERRYHAPAGILAEELDSLDPEDPVVKQLKEQRRSYYGQGT